MKKIAHLVKNPCNPDWRVIKAAKAGLSHDTEVKIFAAATENVSQSEIFDDVHIYRCYPNFNYFSPIDERDTKTRTNLFNDAPAIIAYFLDLYLHKILRGKYPVSPRVIAHKRISRYVSKIYLDDILAFSPDIIHAHDLETLEAALIAKRILRCEVIFDSHEFEVEKNPPAGFFSKLVLKIREARLIKKADLVITVSDEIAEVLQKTYSLKKTPMVIYNVPSKRQFEPISYDDISFFNPEQSIDQIFDYKYKGLYLGLLTINRGIEDSLLALSMLPDHALILAGPRNNHKFFKKLLNLISRYDLTERVFIIDNISKGLISFSKIADYSLVTTLPVCQSSIFSMPNKLFESVAAGLPIVCSDTISAPKFILDHNLGLVYKSTNHFDLARTINELIKSEHSFKASDDLLELLSEDAQYKDLREYYLS